MAATSDNSAECAVDISGNVVSGSDVCECSADYGVVANGSGATYYGYSVGGSADSDSGNVGYKWWR